MTKNISGKTVDLHGRCEHYHTKLDIIGNKCQECRQYWACYKCHEDLTDHAFLPCELTEADSVICGVCMETFSYSIYETLEQCSLCGSDFNPRCKQHKSFYIK